MEVHVFDLDRDLYGETLTVRLVDRIRGDLRLNGLDALKEQMDRDRTMAMQRLATLA